MTFNLETPAGFRGFDPSLPMRCYHRHLPHWRQDRGSYFVTFNLADAVPASKQRELESMRREWEHKFPPPRSKDTWLAYAKTAFTQSETIMDGGFGQCWFQREQYANELHRSLLHLHQQRYELGCFVIMANHCHLVMRPFEHVELEDQIGAIKRATARFVNNAERRSGPLWQQECYDSIIRNDEHLWRVVQYIGRNPGKAKTPKNEWHRWASPSWQAAGWDFLDELDP